MLEGGREGSRVKRARGGELGKGPEMGEVGVGRW